MHHFAILFNSIVSLETVLVPVFDYIVTTLLAYLLKTYTMMTM